MEVNVEIFKDIKNYEKHYQISNYGRVKSLARIDKNNKGTRKKEHFLKPDSSHKNGYKRVTLCKDGVIKRFSVHRLVAEYFLNNPDNKPQINHIDHDPNNNHVSNLEWVTGVENMAHSSIHGRQDECRKLGMEAASKKNQLIAENKYRNILKEFFISTQTVKKSNCTRRYVTYKCKKCNAVYTVRSERRPMTENGTATCNSCYSQDEDIV